MPTLPISEWVEALRILYNQYGYLVVFFGTLGENTALLGLILPGNSLALLGAFYARQGTLHIGWVIFFTWLGTLLGYHIDYLLGRFALSHLLTRCYATKWGRHLRLAARMRLARRILAKHGGKAILFSHTTGHIRSFVALSAGVTHMKYTSFLFFETIAALLWSTAYCLLGYTIAAELDRLQRLIEQAGWIMLVLIIMFFIAWKWQKRRKIKFGQRSSKLLHEAQTTGGLK
jgi:membrane protein DedA with SNARE-associated domain